MSKKLNEGGIYEALKQKHNDVTLISYKLQYPRFLFHKPQKDYASDRFKVDDTQFLLNTVNPFNIFLTGRIIRKRNPDTVIFQWWHPYFAPCYRMLCQILGKKVHKMFICHNVFPHERFFLDKFLVKLALRKGDSYIVHSRSDARDLLSIKKNAVFRHNPLPTYNAFHITGMSMLQARRKLNKGTDEKILLFFGFVREYKGLKHLINAMPKIKSTLGEITLMIVGSFDKDKQKYIELIHKNNVTDCIELIDGYMPDNEVEKYFAACDLVICPYESATQSAIVQIAFGFEKPVIVTNVGGLPDAVDDGVTGYVVEPRNPEALAEAVRKCYTREVIKTFEENIRKQAYRFSWERMTEVIEELQNDLYVIK